MPTLRYQKSLNLFSLHFKKKIGEISTSIENCFYQCCIPTGSIESGCTGERDWWKAQLKETDLPTKFSTYPYA